MYESHYGLSRKPFEISPDPDFLWYGEKHREGLAILKYGILENKGFLLITGEVGTGKTALIRTIEKEVQARAIIVTIPDPGMSLMDFYNFMASELKMGQHFKNKADFLIAFKKLMLEAFSSYRRVLLIIDESQRLNHELLEEIRLLSNIDLGGKVLINIFFVGQSEFREILARQENRAVRQRITVSYHLPSLTEEETGHYIRHRLKVAGAAREIFTPAALKAVYRHASGLPRLTNIVCDHALMTGYVRGLDRIDADVVLECGDDLKITIGGRTAAEKANTEVPPPATVAGPSVPPPRQQSQSGRSVLIFAAFVALLGAGWYFWGDRVSDQLARWGKGREAREAQGSAAGDNSGRTSGAPPLPVETGPRAPKPAEPAVETAKAPVPPAPESVSAAAPKPGLKESPAASEPAIAETKAIASPPAIPPRPAAPATSPAPAPAVQAGASAPPAAAPAASPAPAPAAAEPFTLKDFTVNFAPNSVDLSPAARETLANTAALLKTSRRNLGVVEGHTDITGDAGYNKIIAENRAEAVRNYLVAQGIDASRLSIFSFGSEKPVDTNATPEGRSKNRRVVVRIVPGK
jgi:general secretion pathway protein A